MLQPPKKPVNAVKTRPAGVLQCIAIEVHTEQGIAAITLLRSPRCQGLNLLPILPSQHAAMHKQEPVGVEEGVMTTIQGSRGGHFKTSV